MESTSQFHEPSPLVENISPRGGKKFQSGRKESGSSDPGLWLESSSGGRDDIFGVTSSANTGRILDYLLAKKQLRAYLADVECAFFHAPEEDEVYVEPPQEWKDDHPD